jgi:polyketide biosynthesis acyl carrier protein
MVKRQFRMVSGLTGLLVATGVCGLLSDPNTGWVGSAYAQDSLRGDGDSESWEEDDSGTGGEEFEPAEESQMAGDAEFTAEDEGEFVESIDEPVAEGPAAPESAAETAAEAPPAPSPQIASTVHDKADRVREVLYQHTREVVPGLESHDFKGSDSLRALGANSVDRSEIIMMTLETLGLNVPLIDLAKAENLDQLAGLLASKMP